MTREAIREGVVLGHTVYQSSKTRDRQAKCKTKQQTKATERVLHFEYGTSGEAADQGNASLPASQSLEILSTSKDPAWLKWRLVQSKGRVFDRKKRGHWQHSKVYNDLELFQGRSENVTSLPTLNASWTRKEEHARWLQVAKKPKIMDRRWRLSIDRPPTSTFTSHFIDSEATGWLATF